MKVLVYLLGVLGLAVFVSTDGQERKYAMLVIAVLTVLAFFGHIRALVRGGE